MIEVLPLTHIRGRSLHDAFVIVDEAQSLERGVLLTVLSRIGSGSRVVLTHDIAQRDNLRVGRHDGVVAVIEKLKGHPLFAHVTLTRSERSQIAALVTEMLEDSGLEDASSEPVTAPEARHGSRSLPSWRSGILAAKRPSRAVACCSSWCIHLLSPRAHRHRGMAAGFGRHARPQRGTASGRGRSAHILEQDYPGELELVLAVGPSRDRTLAIAEQLATGHPNVTVVRTRRARSLPG